MFKHVILFPIYAVIVFFVLLAFYMFFWFIPSELFKENGYNGILGYIGWAVFFGWLVLAIGYVSRGKDE